MNLFLNALLVVVLLLELYAVFCHRDRLWPYYVIFALLTTSLICITWQWLVLLWRAYE